MTFSESVRRETRAMTEALFLYHHLKMRVIELDDLGKLKPGDKILRIAQKARDRFLKRRAEWEEMVRKEQDA